MKSFTFINTEKSELHIAKHNITIEEIKSVFNQKILLYRTSKIPPIYEIIGYTFNQKLIVVIVNWIGGDNFFIITAYNGEKKHKRLYNRKVSK